MCYNGCIRGNIIHAMDTNATNAVLEASSAIALASSILAILAISNV